MSVSKNSETELPGVLVLNKADKFICHTSISRLAKPARTKYAHTTGEKTRYLETNPPSNHRYHRTCNNSIDFCVTLQEYLSPYCLNTTNPLVPMCAIFLDERYKTSVQKNTLDMSSVWRGRGERRERTPFVVRPQN